MGEFSQEPNVLVAWLEAVHAMAVATSAIGDVMGQRSATDQYQCLQVARVNLTLADRALDTLELAIQALYQFGT